MCGFHAEGISETYKTSEEQQQLKFVSHAFGTTHTCSRWLKWTLARAVVDTNVYTAHSTRAASTSAANDSGASINLIMKAAGRTNASTFAKFCKKHSEEKLTKLSWNDFNQALR